MSKLGKDQWTTIKSVLKYLHETTYHAIYYQGRVGPCKVLDVHGFVDVNSTGDLDHKISTSGYVFNLFGGVISWMRKKQDVVALSATKYEYMEATHASKEVVWFQKLFLETGFKQQAVRIDCDNHSVIFLEKDLVYHSKRKHIDVPYHFVRDMVERKKVMLEKVDTLDNIVDSLTISKY